MAFILCIETATEVCSVCIGDHNGLIHVSEIDRKNSHTESITLQIRECMDAASIPYSVLSAVAVSSGPGSYTGLRVGTSAAKGICFAHDLPLIAVPTLYGLAYGVMDQAIEGTVIMPMIDARRMEVYTALYNNNLQVINDTHNLILDEGFAEIIHPHRSVIVCGNGSFKILELVESLSKVEVIDSKCSAKDLLSEGLRKFEANEFENLATFSPAYYKSPNITKSRKSILSK